MPPYAKFILIALKIGKMYYSARWLLKMLSTSRVIVLEID